MLKNAESTTRAIVVGRTPSGEGSVRAFLYTEDHGLVGALAKSAREERSKLRAHLQTGTYGMFTLVHGARDWRLIGAFDTANLHFPGTDRAAAGTAAARIMSVVRQLIHGEERNEGLFSALWNFVQVAPELTAEQVRIAERLAMARILSSLGYVALSQLPHFTDNDYSSTTLAAIMPHEKELIHAINAALLASNLV